MNYKDLFDVPAPTSADDFAAKVASKLTEASDARAHRRPGRTMYALSAAVVAFAVFAGGLALWLNHNADSPPAADNSEITDISAAPPTSEQPESRSETSSATITEAPPPTSEQREPLQMLWSEEIRPRFVAEIGDEITLMNGIIATLDNIYVAQNDNDGTNWVGFTLLFCDEMRERVEEEVFSTNENRLSWGEFFRLEFGVTINGEFESVVAISSIYYTTRAHPDESLPPYHALLRTAVSPEYDITDITAFIIGDRTYPVEWA
jgi:hypothetical protein